MDCSATYAASHGGGEAIDYSQELRYCCELLKFVNEMRYNPTLSSGCCHGGRGAFLWRGEIWGGSQAGRGWLTERVNMRMDGPRGRRACVNWEVGSIHYIKINTKQLLNSWCCISFWDSNGYTNHLSFIFMVYGTQGNSRLIIYSCWFHAVFMAPYATYDDIVCMPVHRV